MEVDPWRPRLIDLRFSLSQQKNSDVIISGNSRVGEHQGAYKDINVQQYDVPRGKPQLKELCEVYNDNHDPNTIIFDKHDQNIDCDAKRESSRRKYEEDEESTSKCERNSQSDRLTSNCRNNEGNYSENKESTSKCKKNGGKYSESDKVSWKSVFFGRLLTLAVLWSSISAAATARPMLDLYMNKNEVRRLLGLDADLYYIQNGEVNNYALSFNLPIPVTIQNIFFNWLNKEKRNTIHYTIRFEWDNKRSMDSPLLNISLEGSVPLEDHIFQLTLPCTGKLSADVNVLMFLNITIAPGKNSTQLIFKRKKHCLKNKSSASTSPGNQQSAVWNPGHGTGKGTLDRSTIFYIAVGSTCGVIFVVAIIVAACYLRQSKTNSSFQNHNDGLSYHTSSAGTQLTPLPPSITLPSSHLAPSSLRSGFSYSASRHSLTGNGFGAGCNAPAPLPPPPKFSESSSSQHTLSHVTGFTSSHAHYMRPPDLIQRSVTPTSCPAHSHGLVNGNGGSHLSSVSHGNPPAPPSIVSYSSSTLNSAKQCHQHRSFTPLPELRQSEVRALLKDIEIDRSLVTFGEILAEGTFGRLYHGFLVSSSGATKSVYVKTVTDQASRDQVNLMLSEACLLYGLDQGKPVVPIMHSCLDIDLPPLMIYPFAENGILKRFLQRCKNPSCGAVVTSGGGGEGGATTPGELINRRDVSLPVSGQYTNGPGAGGLSTQQLVAMGLQIVQGMQYLHKRKILHKDLATRNILIDGQLNVMITDSALSRDLFANDYHCLGDNENRPVKWLALESLAYWQFSPASDVWSFGVLLWELMTMGQQPYLDLDPFEMANYLHAGYRLAQPINCPDELYAVMACCWVLPAEERPTFSQLAMCLQDFYNALICFI